VTVGSYIIAFPSQRTEKSELRRINPVLADPLGQARCLSPPVDFRRHRLRKDALSSTDGREWHFPFEFLFAHLGKSPRIASTPFPFQFSIPAVGGTLPYSRGRTEGFFFSSFQGRRTSLRFVIYIFFFFFLSHEKRFCKYCGKRVPQAVSLSCGISNTSLRDEASA